MKARFDRGHLGAIACVLAAALLAVVLGACGGLVPGASAGTSLVSSGSDGRTPFASGADISWVTEQEAKGAAFYNAAGVKTDPFVLLSNLGVNAIRLRVWVNPAGRYNTIPDVLAKARRVAALGQRIMIDFHYSDTWADPSHQIKPAAWASHNMAELKNDVYQHTFNVLTALKGAGIEVSWVEVGNEINAGLMWPDAQTPHFDVIAALTNQGYAAAKAVYPNALVIIHVANSGDDAGCRWFFDNFIAAGGKVDVIGLSHYPSYPNLGATDWASRNGQIGATMTDMVFRYGKPVMVVEIGFPWDDAATAKAMIADIVARTKALGANGLGVFYWEPNAYPNWQDYRMGALNMQGQFTAAMDPL